MAKKKKDKKEQSKKATLKCPNCGGKELGVIADNSENKQSKCFKCNYVITQEKE